MDEPTSVLTPQEVDKLFETLRQLAAEGCSILYISTSCTRSRRCATAPPSCAAARWWAPATRARQTAASMAAADDRRRSAPPARGAGARGAGAAGGQRAVAAERGAVRRRPRGHLASRSAAGEILGIAGVAGNGQNELMLALTGERPLATADPIRIDGIPVGTSGPSRAAWLRPVLRARGAQRPRRRARHDAGRERRAHRGRQRMALRSRRLHRCRQGASLRGQVIGEFDVRTPGIRHAGAQPVRRQPAEVHGRPRGPAEPRRARRLPADLGRGRRRRRRHPPGADHAGRGRAPPSSSSRRTSTSC